MTQNDKAHLVASLLTLFSVWWAVAVINPHAVLFFKIIILALLWATGMAAYLLCVFFAQFALRSARHSVATGIALLSYTLLLVSALAYLYLHRSS